MGVRAISTSSPFQLLLKIVASTTLGISLLTVSLVPLQNRGGLKWRIIIYWAPILTESLCGARLGRYNIIHLIR